MRDAGFVRVRAAMMASVHPLLAKMGLNRPWVQRVLGTTYLGLMVTLQAILKLIKNRRTQRNVSRWLRRYRIFADNIFLVGEIPTKEECDFTRCCGIGF